MPQPATLTDRLANVIQVIQLGRKTGTLTVERNSSGGLEQGMIAFVNGQMTQARAHTLAGNAAFKWLNTWGACRFTFTPSTSPGTTVKLPTLQLDQLAEQQRRGNALNVSIPFQYRALEEALQRIERANLSRAHRRLYLLIDGQRAPAELARLMGRNQNEIDTLLQDLKRTGVIQQ